MCILYLVIFSAAFIPKMEASLHIVGIYTAFVSIVLVTAIDIKNRNHHFLVTLPINRKHIVQAKYMAAMLFTFFGVLSSFGIHVLVKLVFPELNKPAISVIDLLLPAFIILVLTSIYLPLFYAFSNKGIAIINAVFMIILIVLAQPTAIFMNMMNANRLNMDQALLFIPIIILLLFSASYFLTTILFNRKDL